MADLYFVVFAVGSFAGIFAQTIFKRVSGSLRVQAYISLSKFRIIRLFLGLLSTIATIGLFVGGFFLFKWWIVILAFVVAGIAVPVVGFQVMRNLDLMYFLTPPIELISVLAAVTIWGHILGLWS